jgi:hypothetical protein
MLPNGSRISSTIITTAGDVPAGMAVAAGITPGTAGEATEDENISG